MPENGSLTENPRISLHGGPVAFDAVVWTKIDEPTLFTEAELAKLKTLDPQSYTIFRLTSQDGDQGYPGKLLAETLIALVSGGTSDSTEKALGGVTIVYRAKPEDPATVTPVNLTQVSRIFHFVILIPHFKLTSYLALGIYSRRESVGARDQYQGTRVESRGHSQSLAPLCIHLMEFRRPTIWSSGIRITFRKDTHPPPKMLYTITTGRQSATIIQLRDMASAFSCFSWFAGDN